MTFVQDVLCHCQFYYVFVIKQKSNFHQDQACIREYLTSVCRLAYAVLRAEVKQDLISFVFDEIVSRLRPFFKKKTWVPGPSDPWTKKCGSPIVSIRHQNVSYDSSLFKYVFALPQLSGYLCLLPVFFQIVPTTLFAHNKKNKIFGRSQSFFHNSSLSFTQSNVFLFDFWHGQNRLESKGQSWLEFYLKSNTIESALFRGMEINE